MPEPQPPSQHPTQRRYPPELKERAVRMVLDTAEKSGERHGVVARVARQLGINVESLRLWVRQAEVDGGRRPGSYDNALAESINALYKAELIHLRGPWRTVDDVELATLEWVDWYNTRRLHGACTNLPPAEYEALAVVESAA